MIATARSPRFTTLLFGALFIYLVAVLFHLPVLFHMTAALLVAPVVSVGLARVGLRRIATERRLPARLWPDQPVPVELRITNTAPFPKCLVYVQEALPDGLELASDITAGAVAPILWGEPLIHGYAVVARRRGRFRIPPPAISALDPFGLFQPRIHHGVTSEVVAYPRRVELVDHGLRASAPEGIRRWRQPVSSGIDFRGTREYLPGDDLRRVHWRSTARLNKPIVMEFEDPTTPEMVILLDSGAATQYGAPGDDTFETGITLAASLLTWELERGHAVALVTASDDLAALRPTRERDALEGFLERLALAETRSDLDLLALARETAGRAGQRALLVIVSARLDPRWAETLVALAGARPVSLAWLDPAGYPAGGAALYPGDLFSALRPAGVACFRIRRGEVAAGLTAPV